MAGWSEDLAIARRIVAGDEASFTALVRSHQPALLAVARAMVGADAAEEVVQETWIQVLRGLARFEGRSALKSWMVRIAINCARSRLRRDRRELPLLVAEADLAADGEGTAADFTAHGGWSRSPARPSPASPEERLLSAELRQVLERTLAELPPAQALVVRLRDVEELTAAEVCNGLDISESNQRVLLHRGRVRLRRALEPYLTRAPESGPRKGKP